MSTNKVDLNAVKQYNTSLKAYKDQASTLKAQADYINNEINTICSELSAELGIQVTVDNIEQIYNDTCNKINSTLSSGNVVLSKIEAEMNKPSITPTGMGVGMATPTPTMNTTTQEVVAPTPVAPAADLSSVAPVTDVAQNAQNLVNNTMGTDAGASALNGVPTVDNMGVGNMAAGFNLPPMFH